MSKSWIPVGCSEFQKRDLSKETKRSILAVLNHIPSFTKLEKPKLEEFWLAMGLALSFYVAAGKLKEKNRPADVREQLEAIRKKAGELDDKLNKLGSLASWILQKHAQNSALTKVNRGFHDWWDILALISGAAKMALDEAKEYPNRSPEYRRRLLAQDIEKALDRCLGIKASDHKQFHEEIVSRLIEEAEKLEKK